MKKIKERQIGFHRKFNEVKEIKAAEHLSTHVCEQKGPLLRICYDRLAFSPLG